MLLIIELIIYKMQGRITEKIYKDVNLERRGNRNRKFEQNRKNREPTQNEMEEGQQPEEADYLHFYPPPLHASILHSLTAPVPAPLPPLAIDTISYYRRSNQPIFQTRIPGSVQLDGHMTYESLSILAHIEQSKYGNYAALVKQFQRELSLYLSANSKDIREMAVIAAGNKILGREKDVLNLVAANPQNLWVLVNHVYENKISYKHLFPHLLAGRELAFKALYLMSNMKGDESILDMSDNDDILDRLIEYLQSPNVEIQRNSIRIIGNIIGQGEEFVEIFEKFKLIDSFFKLLMVKDETTLKDVCWLIANYSSTSSSATSIIRHPMIRGRLMDLLYADKGIPVKKEIIHVFNYLAHFANKVEAFQFLVNEQLLNICHGYLMLEDAEINIVSLHLINGLLQLGVAFPNEHGQNVVQIMVDSMFELRCEVERKSESENTQMSGVAYEILGILRGESEDML